MTDHRIFRRAFESLSPQPPDNSPKNLATGYTLSEKEKQLILEKLTSNRCLTSLITPLPPLEK